MLTGKKKHKSDKDEIRYTSKEIIISLSTMPQLVRQLCGRGKKYDNLITEILKYNFYSGDSYRPDSKELQELLKISPATYKAQLEEIYLDFLELLHQDEIWEIKNIRCEIWVDVLDVVRIIPVRLPIVPRVGEKIEMKILEPVYGVGIFTVHEVSHELRENEQVILVFGKMHDFSWYERLLDDKAKYEGTYNHIEGLRREKNMKL